MVSNSSARLTFFATVLVVAMAGYTLFALAEPAPLLAAPMLQEEATPDPCGAPVLRPAGGEINVRSGPGLNYSPINSLDRDESAPIVGRAAYVQFWQVELADGTVGWVGNGVVVVDGYVEDLPIVEAPQIDDATATPGQETWRPTARIECLATHTPTPAPATPTPRATATPDPDADAMAGPWRQPANVSKSGKATNLQSVVDSQGTIHVVWQEAGIGNFFYARGNMDEWSEAVPVELPFGTRRFYSDLGPTDPTPLFRPTLVTDASGRIHALWIDEAQTLRHSSVVPDAFGAFSEWTERQTLGTDALVAKATTDDGGRLHLVYIRTLPSEEAPAGVYYRQLAGGAEWSEPALLYNSAYLRSLTAGNANLQIAASDSGNDVYVAWDNLPLEKVFLARSADAGQSWESAQEIDRREAQDGSGATGPRQLKVSSSADGVLLLWQAGHSGKACAHYYAWSADAGDTWSTPRELDPFPDCSPENQLFSSGDGSIFLLTGIDPDAYLLAWNGERWSTAQHQETLTSFVNADTFQTVDLDCLQAHIVQDAQIAMVGCSTGEVQDVWVTTRPLGAPQDWFPAPSPWREPGVISSNSGEPQDLRLAADAEGRLHSIWTNAASLTENAAALNDDDAALTNDDATLTDNTTLPTENAATLTENAIYYTRWSDSWSQALPVLTSPEGSPVQPDLAVSQDQHLLVVWSDSRTGRIYFSGAEAEEAITPANWSTPQALASPDAIATSPDIIAGPDGTVYVVYAIPVNEGRGIYLVKSEDNGKTWAAPTLVFDGLSLTQAANINPHLAIATDGQLHLLWQLYSLPPETAPRALYYTRSTDGGQSWATPELVVEAPVVWSHIERANSGILYRLWQESSGTQTTLQFQTSVDEGNSWDYPAILPDLSGAHAPVSAIMDAGGRLHLLQLGNGVLQHWAGDGEQWRAEEPLALDVAPAGNSRLVATIDEENVLQVIYSTLRSATEETPPANVLLSTNRTLAPAAEPAAPLPTPTPTPVPSPTPSPTAAPSPTPTRPFPTDFQGGGGSPIPFADSDNPLLRGLAAILPALLIILVGVAIGWRSIRAPRG